MFGFVNASIKELSDEQKQKYTAVYCGICRDISKNNTQLARLTLSYDMVFLAMLLESLYEPEITEGKRPCLLHPCNSRCWSQSKFTEYAAQMNVALAYYKCLDDWHDDHRLSAVLMKGILEPEMAEICKKYPRQCKAIEECISKLSELESTHCANPDLPAGTFGQLMEELMVYTSDYWEPYLRQLGNALGRFIYLCDAAMDFKEDEKKNHYNPYLAMGMQSDYHKWDEYLMLTMGRCTQAFEMLPLVDNKGILDNILYSGVWLQYRAKQKKDSGEDSE